MHEVAVAEGPESLGDEVTSDATPPMFRHHGNHVHLAEYATLYSAGENTCYRFVVEEDHPGSIGKETGEVGQVLYQFPATGTGFKLGVQFKFRAFDERHP